MFLPGAVTVRKGCRDEKSATWLFWSTAPTETTPKQTAGSSTGLLDLPSLPLAVNFVTEALRLTGPSLYSAKPLTPSAAGIEKPMVERPLEARNRSGAA